MAQIKWFNSFNDSAATSVCPDTLRGHYQPYIFKPIYH